MSKITDLINDMIFAGIMSTETTSANPTHVNTTIGVNERSDPDIESAILDLLKEGRQINEKPSVGDPIQNLKQKKDIGQLKEKLDIFDKGNVGDIQRLTSEQFGNVRSLAQNPTGFLMNTFFRKFAKGVGIVALALVIFEAVKWIIGELMKPGRLLDRRFKRDMRNEIISFRRREEQQKLKQGFSNIIITTMSGLRGGRGQIYNTHDWAGGRTQIPASIGMDAVLMDKASGRSFPTIPSGKQRYG